MGEWLFTDIIPPPYMLSQ